MSSLDNESYIPNYMKLPNCSLLIRVLAALCFSTVIIQQLGNLRQNTLEEATQNMTQAEQVHQALAFIKTVQSDKKPLTPDDICLTVMTGINTHSRLPAIIKTWYKPNRNHTYFFRYAKSFDNCKNKTGWFLAWFLEGNLRHIASKTLIFFKSLRFFWQIPKIL